MIPFTARELAHMRVALRLYIDGLETTKSNTHPLTSARLQLIELLQETRDLLHRLEQTRTH